MSKAKAATNWWLWMGVAFVTGAWPVVGIIAILAIILLGK